ncbi:mechanosensitive ion channel family protein [Methylotenera versatilis]|uniref:mechanosensitive ion channel family protein n=1 Tax=Methylotenera versatilis TaxID=1055487 RepID=UPI00068EC1D3|nr:mechanosensitive ion channel family protein [Methylotenera versatilis]
MMNDLNLTAEWLVNHAVLQTFIYAGLLLLIAWFVNSVVKVLLVKLAFNLLSVISLENVRSGNKLIKRIANILPAIVIAIGIPFIPGVPDVIDTIIQNIANAFIVLTIALAANDALNVGNSLYLKRPDAHLHPIKGYIQVAKLVVIIIATILIVATLIDRSPVILLSGVGAMAAVLMLIFQDTILSLVASIQINSNDIVRVGDWIEMPQLNADGDVIDVALHTVKVQNWDKTITTIPTKKLISESFKNWRGMQESGGRRIKRTLYIDQNSIQFIDADTLVKMQSFGVLKDFISKKSTELEEWNKKLADKGLEQVNARKMTNIGNFRAYVELYLRNHQNIHQDMTLLVRQLNPTPNGLPIEVYCFTKTTKWAEYESIQSDIFDHLFAIINHFELRVFQNPSGLDFANYGSEKAQAA